MSAGTRGFTLIEVLVAMALFGLLLVTIAGGVRLVHVSSDRLVARGQEIEELAVLRGFLQERLGDAVWVDFGVPGRVEAAFVGRREDLRFLTVARDHETSPAFLAVEVGMVREGGIRLAVARLPADRRDFGGLGDAAAADRPRLLAGIETLRFAYFGRKEGAAPAWHDEWTGQPRLPRAVRVELGDDRFTWPALVVRIQQDVAARCPVLMREAACVEP